MFYTKLLHKLSFIIFFLFGRGSEFYQFSCFIKQTRLDALDILTVRGGIKLRHDMHMESIRESFQKTATRTQRTANPQTAIPVKAPLM